MFDEFINFVLKANQRILNLEKELKEAEQARANLRQELDELKAQKPRES